MSRNTRKEIKEEIVRIIIPEEAYSLIESTDPDGMKAIMVVNSSLKEHQEDSSLKETFNWYCSVIFDFRDMDGTLWPTSEEFSIMQEYTETFNKAIKGDVNHPNALFVARVTYKGTCQMIWMLHNPRPVTKYLNDIIEEGRQKREFSYLIEGDPKWNSIWYFLQAFPLKHK